jgi:hypothetical protein
MTDDLRGLLKSAPAPAMGLDENAVLSGGRRRQRRRRLTQVLASAATVAVIALGGWWVGGPGRDDTLPGGPSRSTTAASVTATGTTATGTTGTGTATPTSTATGNAPDNVLRAGVAEEVATMNTPYLPVATERLRAVVTVAASGSATGRVTPVAGPDEGTVSLAAGAAGAFVLPGVKDATAQTAHVYGLVRAGAGELTIAGPGAPAHWSTSTFPVEGTDVVLVVVTVPVTSGAGARWTISWQSVDGAHSVPVVAPGG